MNISNTSYNMAQAIINAIASWGDGENHGDILLNLAEEIHNTIVAPTPVRVWREDKTIPLPVYMTNGAACCDIYAKSFEVKGHRLIVHTGLHVALPLYYEMELRPRSGLTKTRLVIANSPGTIDEDYRGEILVVFETFDDVNLYEYLNNYLNNDVTDELYFPYKKGERVAQIMIRKIETISWVEVEELEDLGVTERGNGGHGSTGNK